MKPSKKYLESLEKLIFSGRKLSNIAFNLGQCKGHEIEDRDAESMREGFKEWDKCLLDFRKQRP